MAISKDSDAKQLVLKNGQTLLPPLNSPTIQRVPLTRTHFLDAYSKGKWNLSNVPCPSCFDDRDVMTPPDSYNEITRLKSVEKYMNNEQWKNRQPFMKLIAKALKHFNCKGASISLVDDKRQINKFQKNLNIIECPKKISIDAHAVLSSGIFVLLDASKDWRSSKNPFVKNVPYIKFYAGVPLVTKLGAVIGVFAVFDSFPRKQFTKKHNDFLQELADEVMTILNSPMDDQNQPVVGVVPLLQVIGRPTTQGNHSVYEKDGSGSQYSQNYNFRYSKHTGSKFQELLFDSVVVRAITSSRDIKVASTALCQIIVSKIHYDFCAIIEIRLSQRYQIASEYFPQENTVDVETFAHPEHLKKVDKEHVISRILGSYGYTNSDAFLDSPIYYSSLSSEFGVYFDNVTNPMVKQRTGIVMPFYRVNSKLVRKKKIIRKDKINNTSKPIELYLRSGGYLVAAFKEQEEAMKDHQIDFIYGSACALRRHFISN